MLDLASNSRLSCRVGKRHIGDEDVNFCSPLGWAKVCAFPFSLATGKLSVAFEHNLLSCALDVELAENKASR